MEGVFLKSKRLEDFFGIVTIAFIFFIIIIIMEKDSIVEYYNVKIGNFHIYLFLEDGKDLQIILHFLLDDGVFYSKIHDTQMPQPCKKLFATALQLFSYVCMIGTDEKLLQINDIGGIKIVQLFEKKDKVVKVQSYLQCQRITDVLLINKLLFKIIKNQKQYNHKNKESRTNFPQQQQQISYLKKNQGKQLMVTVDMINNPYLLMFSKTNDLIQISGFSKTRLKLYFHEIFPKTGSYFVSVKIVSLKANAFALGIIDKNENKQIIRSPYSISFQFRTGEIKDSNKKIDKKETSWHQSGVSTVLLADKVLSMMVNMSEGIVRFLCNNTIVGQTFITKYLMEKELTPYISCKHQGDKFIINHKK